MLEGAFDPPDFYFPFTHAQAIADELRCTVREALSPDPITLELRRYAMLKLLAESQAADRRKQGATAT